MGLFDRHTKVSSTPQLSLQEAIAGVLFSAVAADGEISEDESFVMTHALMRMKPFGDMSEDELSETIGRAIKFFVNKGSDALVDACKPLLSQEMRETVFAVACDIVIADGEVAEEENEFVARTQTALEIDPQLADRIVEVIVIKNRG